MAIDARSASLPGDSTRGFQWAWLREGHKLLAALAGGACLAAAVLVGYFGGPPAARMALILAAYLICGWYNFFKTIHTLRRFRFDIDVLMFAAAFGAAAIGHPAEGALLLFLFALGGAGEEMALDRARRAISALGKLAPETAIRREADGTERVVHVKELTAGDVVIVRPFDRVAADGTVQSGASAVDQSPITGESIPAEKAPGSAVFAGTVNGEGMLVIVVSKPAHQSTLARIVRMVEEAQAAKSPTQVFTDRVERWYVPAVLLATALLILLPPLLGGSAWKLSFYRAMAFLTAASPCALAIGTPAAVLSGIAQAARIGVLIKGGAHLENLGRVRVIAFDKTGTLTQGRPVLTDVVVLNSMKENELLSYAAALERNSTHPLARAIVAEAESRRCPEWAVESLEQVPALGVRAQAGGKLVAVGRLSIMPAGAANQSRAKEAIDRLASEGKTTVIVAVEGAVAGVIGLADRPRENAAASLARLRELGIKRMIMLTGDNAAVAAAVAKQVGVDEHFANLLPQDKTALVAKFRDQYGAIAMIGDGANDAPALATATVGIAMGGAGTDVALETADVALMADDLSKLPHAIALSRAARRIIQENLVIAIGVILVIAPTAAIGRLPLSIAVLLHEGSTVVVVCNALRLLLFTPRKDSM